MIMPVQLGLYRRCLKESNTKCRMDSMHAGLKSNRAYQEHTRTTHCSETNASVDCPMALLGGGNRNPKSLIDSLITYIESRCTIVLTIRGYYIAYFILSNLHLFQSFHRFQTTLYFFQLFFFLICWFYSKWCLGAFFMFLTSND